MIVDISNTVFAIQNEFVSFKILKDQKISNIMILVTKVGCYVSALFI